MFPREESQILIIVILGKYSNAKSRIRIVWLFSEMQMSKNNHKVIIRKAQGVPQ